MVFACDDFFVLSVLLEEDAELYLYIYTHKEVLAVTNQVTLIGGLRFSSRGATPTGRVFGSVADMMGAHVF